MMSALQMQPAILELTTRTLIPDSLDTKYSLKTKKHDVKCWVDKASPPFVPGRGGKPVTLHSIITIAWDAEIKAEIASASSGKVVVDGCEWQIFGDNYPDYRMTIELYVSRPSQFQ